MQIFTETISVITHCLEYVPSRRVRLEWVCKPDSALKYVRNKFGFRYCKQLSAGYLDGAPNHLSYSLA